MKCYEDSEEGEVTCLRSIGESEIKKGFLEEVAFETDWGKVKILMGKDGVNSRFKGQG